MTAPPAQGRRRWPALGLAPCAVLIASCGVPGEAGGTDDRTPLVVVSIAPVADLVRLLAGEGIRVETLLPPRSAPATYEPPARRRAALAGSVALRVFVGGGLDAWAETLVTGGTLLRITEGMALSGHHAHGDESATGDPHVWLDPEHVRLDIVPRLADAVAAIDPAGASAVRARQSALSDSLAALDAEFRSRLAPLRGAGLVTAHGGWHYLAERYELHLVGSVHERPGWEPSARHVAGLVDGARALHVRTVYAEPQLSAAAAHVLAAELDAAVLELDPLGGVGVAGREGYFDLLRFNLDQLVGGLVEPPHA